MFISEVVRGGAAELDGRLMQGDQILSVNGEDTRHASQEAVAAILKVNPIGSDLMDGSVQPVCLTGLGFCPSRSVLVVQSCWSSADSKLLLGSRPDTAHRRVRWGSPVFVTWFGPHSGPHEDVLLQDV